MLQRGLLTIAEQPPYDTTSARTTSTTTATTLENEAANLAMEHERTNNKQEMHEFSNDREPKERFQCLPIIEMPLIKIEPDLEYMEQSIEEQQVEEQQDTKLQARHEELEEQNEMNMKTVAQLMEPTSILKSSLLTGAANTLATLTAAAEQIARMPPSASTVIYNTQETMAKNVAYFKEENKRLLYTDDRISNEEQLKAEAEQQREHLMCLATSSALNTPAIAISPTTTYTSILQTALMSKRPATLNVASTLATASLTATTISPTKSLHVRTPDQVLKTAVTLATLGEIAAQQEQQQLQQQQQQHILVLPQMQQPRKMCTLPFKKLNFATVTSSPNTASANTTTTITNNFLGSNIKSTILCSSNTSNNQAASIIKTTATTTTTAAAAAATTINSNPNKNKSPPTLSSNLSSPHFKSQVIAATQTLKIPHIRPQLVTTQTQTEDNLIKFGPIKSNGETVDSLATSRPLTSICFATSLSPSTSVTASSLQTASTGLLRTAVTTSNRMLPQTASSSILTQALSSAASAKSSSLQHIGLATDNNAGNIMMNTRINMALSQNVAGPIVKPSTNVAQNVAGNFLSNFANSNLQTNIEDNEAGLDRNFSSNIVKASNSMTKLKILPANTSFSNASSTPSPPSLACHSNTSSTSSSPSSAVTVVVFETLLPED